MEYKFENRTSAVLMNACNEQLSRLNEYWYNRENYRKDSKTISEFFKELEKPICGFSVPDLLKELLVSYSAIARFSIEELNRDQKLSTREEKLYSDASKFVEYAKTLDWNSKSNFEHLRKKFLETQDKFMEIYKSIPLEPND